MSRLAAFGRLDTFGNADGMGFRSPKKNISEWLCCSRPTVSERCRGVEMLLPHVG